MLLSKKRIEQIERVKRAMAALENHKFNNDSQAQILMSKVFDTRKRISFSGASDLYLDETGFYFNDPIRDMYFVRINFATTNWPAILVEAGLNGRKKLFEYIKNECLK
jgi:hypothetical protein